MFKELYQELAAYKSFVIDDALLVAKVTMNEPCYKYNAKIQRVYPNVPVFIVNAICTSNVFDKYNSETNSRIYPNKIEYTRTGNDFSVICHYYNGETETVKITAYDEALPGTEALYSNDKVSADVPITLEGLCDMNLVECSVSHGAITYHLIDLFKLGSLNRKQKSELEKIFLRLSEGEYDELYMCNTIYFTDSGDVGLWSYQFDEPLPSIEKLNSRKPRKYVGYRAGL